MVGWLVGGVDMWVDFTGDQGYTKEPSIQNLQFIALEARTVLRFHYGLILPIQLHVLVF